MANQANRKNTTPKTPPGDVPSFDESSFMDELSLRLHNAKGLARFIAEGAKDAFEDDLHAALYVVHDLIEQSFNDVNNLPQLLAHGKVEEPPHV